MVRNTFVEGDPVSTSIDLSKPLLTFISLKTTEYILIPETSGCDSVSHYECLSEHLWTSQYANCTHACCKEIGRSCIPLSKIQEEYSTDLGQGDLQFSHCQNLGIMVTFNTL